MFSQNINNKFLGSLDHIEYGRLSLTMPDGKTRFFEGCGAGPSPSLIIHDSRVPANLAFRGDTGFAMDYRDGLWETDDLVGLITLALKNESAMTSYIFGGTLAQIAGRLSNLMRLNTRQGSRRNIHAHYDLGNEFYKLWLDPTMTYSSALFDGQDQSLAHAQLRKYDRIIDHLGNASGSILEIGCGWGGFAERACARGDYDVKGITLSDEQFTFAKQRLNGSATIVLEDYRNQKSQYDSIVSIEMFEAVGERYWKTYFTKLASLLKQDGRAVVQTINIDENRFDHYRRSSDFIRNFIFPGGMLPTTSRFAQEAADAGLRINDCFEFGQDYARTLEIWLKNFDEQKDKVLSLGFDDGFIRLWRFYLAACIAGFRTGRTGVMQVELQHV